MKPSNPFENHKLLLGLTGQNFLNMSLMLRKAQERWGLIQLLNTTAVILLFVILTVITIRMHGWFGLFMMLGAWPVIRITQELLRRIYVDPVLKLARKLNKLQRQAI